MIVAGASFGYRGPLGQVAEHPLAGFLGKISCGVFACHLLVLWAVDAMVPGLRGGQPVRGSLLVGAATILTAPLSRHLIEEPIARLKRHFPTRGLPRPAEAQAADRCPAAVRRFRPRRAEVFPPVPE